jgi:uncharacterized protein (TIGR02246 family)
MKKFLITVLLFSFCWAEAQTKKEEERAIRQSRQASNEAIAKKDLKGISKFWMDDFVQVRGNGSFLVGKDIIKEGWQKMFSTTPEVSFERNPVEVIISDSDPNLAWETGTWKGLNTYSKGGRYSAMWKKQNDNWKLQAELFVGLLK